MPESRAPLAAKAIALVVLLVAASGCTGSRSGRPTAIPGQPGRGTAAEVVRVVDGDTVDLAFAEGTERSRLLGIDTPETVKPDTPVECFGPEASARTKELLAPGTPVLVQRDTEARDRYGRLLVYIWRRADGLFVNRVLVAEGLARPLSIAPNTTYRADLARAAGTAQTAGAGLWGACRGGSVPGVRSPS